ncbi:phage major capsid protein [Paludicola sp. MB14-C6]|uniref:phage major capsid protein n=1 Tax=Paludihabitans sp. MB14-C6 TaxID=3070656 RepID=UPI0027DAE0B7|nr:phage major capsid protein [Paludicola sp. MB14-C6]WMJ23727.1 phage major capsid protein [Paludicola sp. MB14-C6]
MAFYDNITLEKGMYHSNKSFSQVLEELDPTSNYQGSDLSNLDAFERQLKRFDIKVKGQQSDTLSKFFQTTQSAALFPEYVKRCVIQGLTEANILHDIIATNTKIDSFDYRPITCISNDEDKKLNRIAEGAQIPTTEIKMQDRLIQLYKRGRMLLASYEALKSQRLDLFAITLKQIGAYIAKSQLEDAIEVIQHGDDNLNVAEVVGAATAGTLTYDDLINLWSKFESFEMNRLLVAPDVMVKLLNIAELKNPATGLNFQATGKLSTPLGATLYRSSCIPSGKIIALDKNFALEKVTASEVSIDSDKLIDRQLERSAITSIAGFAKIFEGASKILEV